VDYFRLRRAHHCHVVGRLFVAYASRDRLDSVSSSREGTDRYALQWRLAETKKSTLSRANDHPKTCSKASFERKEKYMVVQRVTLSHHVFHRDILEKNSFVPLNIFKSIFFCLNKFSEMRMNNVTWNRFPILLIDSTSSSLLRLDACFVSKTFFMSCSCDYTTSDKFQRRTIDGVHTSVCSLGVNLIKWVASLLNLIEFLS